MYMISDNVSIRELIRKDIMLSGNIKSKLVKAGYFTLDSIQNFAKNSNNCIYQINNDICIGINDKIDNAFNFMNDYLFCIKNDILNSGIIDINEYEFMVNHPSLFCNLENFGNNNIIIRI